MEYDEMLYDMTKTAMAALIQKNGYYESVSERAVQVAKETLAGLGFEDSGWKVSTEAPVKLY